MERIDVLERFAIYENSDHHAFAGGPPYPSSARNMQGWGIGAKMTGPWWERRRGGERVCVRSGSEVTVRVRLALTSPARRAATGSLRVRPKLDRSSRHLKVKRVEFAVAAGAKAVDVDVRLRGRMPREIGRFILQLELSGTVRGYRFVRTRARRRIYTVYDTPLDPDYDSRKRDDDGSAGRVASPDTVTGTPRRLDHLTKIIGPRTRRHACATVEDLEDLVWRIHLAINNSNPPYFDGGHARQISHNGRSLRSGGKNLPVTDQWLMWVTSPPNPDRGRGFDTYWNDASCIGHVQLAKTMLAAVGLFSRRCWVHPITSRLPKIGEPVTPTWRGHVLKPGGTLKLRDEDCYSTGTRDDADRLQWKFPHAAANRPPIIAEPKLMERGAYEDFEACLLSPTGRFLPGGFPTRQLPAHARKGKGFASAIELLRWWCNTKRSDFGKRFMAWVGKDSQRVGSKTFTVNSYYDVDGFEYYNHNYEEIRGAKELPPP